MMSVGDIMSTLGIIMSTLLNTKMQVGFFVSTPERYHEYTGDVGMNKEKATTKFQGFLFSHLLRLCRCICWPLEHQTACYNLSIK